MNIRLCRNIVPLYFKSFYAPFGSIFVFWAIYCISCILWQKGVIFLYEVVGLMYIKEKVSIYLDTV